MSTSKVNNKKIVKNTLFLYLRMIVVMGIGLYTVRAILHLLGVVDYGIYNVVGGVVSMFTFLNGTLSTSSQRYFSIELAKGDTDRLNKWFCLNVSTFSIFILIFLVIAETAGLWFVNTQMTIPQERLFAANVVYQLSIVSFCIHFFSIPYNALIIAHEKMSAFAYISIVDALFKLVIVFILSIISWDKLIVYGLLMLLSSCGITSSYIIYNRIHFTESKFRPYWNRKEIFEILGFSGWHFMGTFSFMIRSQGINILLNLFFNPVINAARAIAYQIYHAVSQLSNNFFTAVKPQIYKSYANKEYDELYKLINRSTVMSTFLVSIITFPILANTPYILGLWLKEVPEYSIIFTQLVLINGLIDSTGGPTIASALATGKIRKYQQCISTLIILNLPLSYIALSLGAEPQFTLLISIIISTITALVRGYFLQPMIGFPYLRYFLLLSKISAVSATVWLISYYIFYGNVDSFFTLIISILTISACIISLYYIFLINKSDKIILLKTIRRYVTHK